MNTTETLATLGTQDKNGQCRDIGNIGYTRHEWTIQRHWQHWVHKIRMDNTETLATLGTQDKNGQQKDTGNIGYTRQEWTIQRHW